MVQLKKKLDSNNNFSVFSEDIWGLDNLKLAYFPCQLQIFWKFWQFNFGIVLLHILLNQTNGIMQKEIFNHIINWWRLHLTKKIIKINFGTDVN